MKTLDELADNIYTWHKERGIIDNGKVETQVLKLMEEMGELAEAVAKDKIEDVKDALGDMFVVQNSIAHLVGITMRESVSHAYNEIKDRPGYLLPNGNFIKTNE